MRARTAILPLALVCLAASGCILETARRDGAACSRDRTCPPGQQCSYDGQCLYPCPRSNCVDNECGCTSVNRSQDAKTEGGGFTCMADGLCHLKCGGDPGMGGSGSCWGWTACDSSRWICLPACEDQSQCATGSTCYITGTNPGGGTPTNYCLGTGPTGDGGVPDGGTKFESLVNVGSGLVLNGLAVGGNEVFWADQSSDAIWKCSKQGCAQPTRLTQSGTGNVRSLVVDVPGTIFFWGAADSMLRGCSTGGCPGAPSFQVSYQGNGIAVDGDNVYFFDGGHVRTCAQLGCINPRNITTASIAGELWALGSGMPGVFWTVKNEGTVLMCPNAGCGGSPAEFASGQDSPQALAFLGNDVFWRGSTEIVFCPGGGCGGAPQRVVSFASDSITGAMNRLAVAPHGVYWDTGGTLFRCADTACTGGKQTLTTNFASFQLYAADTDALYFFNYNVLQRYRP